MTKRRYHFPALSWIVAAGAIFIALDQILLWASCEATPTDIARIQSVEENGNRRQQNEDGAE
ncbi:hypothetical protein [Cohnella panacarvi]|uniref:hypothetical protein n=1 Tax=Cohnella panacarvi TaxID=400776 RepID=UPI0012EB8F57|nr:hypothetical protein [Cohnella panacarvi]